ncbi:gamma carbonic anhydrase family protein [Spongorhabdus nitratireducens]
MSNNLRPHKGITPVLGQKVFVDESAVVIGDVEIGDDSSVWPAAVVRGDMHRIRIGERTSVQDGAVLHITHASSYNPDGFPLTIGSDVTIGHKAVLHGCTVHDRVLIGIGAIVMDGAIIESDVLLAAGAMVPPGKTLESGYVYKGSPAKQARPLTESEHKFLSYSPKNYVRLKDEYLNPES